MQPTRKAIGRHQLSVASTSYSSFLLRSCRAACWGHANAIVKNGGLKRGRQLLDQEVAVMKILSGSVEEGHSR